MQITEKQKKLLHERNFGEMCAFGKEVAEKVRCCPWMRRCGTR